MFGIGGNRPNGFILTQGPYMLAHWLPVALSTGQITPQSAIHCCLSICMLFSCLVTWLFQSATSYVIFFQRDQSFWCFKWSDVDQIINQTFNIFLCRSFLCLFSTEEAFEWIYKRIIPKKWIEMQTRNASEPSGCKMTDGSKLKSKQTNTNQGVLVTGEKMVSRTNRILSI